MVGSILIFLICVAVFIFISIFLANVILLAMGKITREQLKENAEKFQKENQVKNQAFPPKKNKKGSLWFFSLPSPLNNWSLWN